MRIKRTIGELLFNFNYGVTRLTSYMVGMKPPSKAKLERIERRKQR